MSALSIFVLVGIYLVAIYTDVKTLTIKNWLTLPAILIGLIGCVFTNGFLPALYFLIAIAVASFICEVTGMWAPGDSKLFMAGSLFTSIYLQSASLLISGGVWFGIVVLYLVIGHFLWLKKCKFNIGTYLRDLTFNRNQRVVIGKMPGSITIAIGNIAFIAMILFSF